MSRPSYLVQSRHGIYYFRFVFPDWVRAQRVDLPKELRLSLRTRNRAVALSRSYLLAHYYRTFITKMSQSKEPPMQLVHTITDAYGQTHRLEWTKEEEEAAANHLDKMVQLGLVKASDAADPIQASIIKSTRNDPGV